MNHADISRLFAYTEWANHLVLDAAEALTAEQLARDFGSGQHSVFETLTHMMGAEWVWFERWEGGGYKSFAKLEGPLKLKFLKPEELPVLRDGWKELEANRAELLAGLTEEALQASITYTSLKGEQFSQPLIDQMQHVVNHATHHRGQIVGFLRALGVTPPTTDMIHYFRTVA